MTRDGPGLNHSVLVLRSYQVMSYISLPLSSVSGSPAAAWGRAKSAAAFIGRTYSRP